MLLERKEQKYYQRHINNDKVSLFMIRKEIIDTLSTFNKSNIPMNRLFSKYKLMSQGMLKFGSDPMHGLSMSSFSGVE